MADGIDTRLEELATGIAALPSDDKEGIAKLEAEARAIREAWTRNGRRFGWAFSGVLAAATLALAFVMVVKDFKATAAWIAVIAALALSVLAASLLKD